MKSIRQLVIPFGSCKEILQRKHYLPRRGPVTRCRHYSIAVVGLGHRGYGSHFKSLVESPSDSIVAVCDTNRHVLQSFTHKHPHVPTYLSLTELLQLHRPDFAIVSIPHRYHMECVMTLAENGISVLKEKPVAESLEDFHKMTTLPVKIGITFQKRFEPQFADLRRLLEQVGDVVRVEARLTLNIENLEETWRAWAGVGTTEDLGCHIVDIVAWLFGVPSSVLTYGVSSVRPGQIYGGDDISDVIMDWAPLNRIGHIHMSRVGYDFSQMLIITGTNGHIILDGCTLTLIDSAGRKKLHMSHQFTEKDVIRSMTRDFGDWVTGKRPTFSSSLDNLADTVSTVHAVRSSLFSRTIQTPLTLSTKRVSSTTNEPHTSQVFLRTATAGYSTKASPRKCDQVFALRSGGDIPAISLGTRRSQWPGQVYYAVRAALQEGYRSIDTAQSSGNEEEIGQAIRDSGIPRQKISITTKLQNSWHHRAAEALDRSLKALNTDHVDFYLMHWPISQDPENPSQQLRDWNFVQTWRDMQQIPRSKARNIGVSNFGISHLETLAHDESCKVVPAVNQIEMHPYWPSKGLLSYCRSHGIHCIAYSCLGSAESPIFDDPAVLAISRSKGRTPQQILIMWALQRGTSVVPKSVDPSRIRANLDLDGWDLNEGEIAILDQLGKFVKTCGDDWLPGKVFFEDDV